MVLVLGNYRRGGAVCVAVFVLDFAGGLLLMEITNQAKEAFMELVEEALRLSALGGKEPTVSIAFEGHIIPTFKLSIVRHDLVTAEYKDDGDYTIVPMKVEDIDKADEWLKITYEELRK